MIVSTGVQRPTSASVNPKNQVGQNCSTPDGQRCRTSRDKRFVNSRDERCESSKDERYLTPRRKRAWTRATILPSTTISASGENEENEGGHEGGLDSRGMGGQKKKVKRGSGHASSEADKTEKDDAGWVSNQLSLRRTKAATDSRKGRVGYGRFGVENAEGESENDTVGSKRRRCENAV